MIRVGINGFGRVGRALYRVCQERPGVEIAAINDINPDPGNIAYLLQYDSTYGKLPGTVLGGDGHLSHDGRKIPLFSESSVAGVPWARHGVDVVVEATGVIDNVRSARGCLGGPVRKVVVTSSPEEVDQTIVFGVNEGTYDPASHDVIAASICDANACAPVLRLLWDAFGIEHGFCTTLHPWLSYQNLMDGPSKSQAIAGEIYHHYALGRDSTASIIPKPTTVIAAVERVLPAIRGKFDCFSYRVPTKVVASADLSVKLGRKTTLPELQALLKAGAARSPRILRWSDEPLVSIDFAQTEQSAAVDGRWLQLRDAEYAKIVLWYDNEWGYAHRVADLLSLVGGTLCDPRKLAAGVKA
ncbi:MAG: aldehyde dehydrogenase [Elusimicrobia bacterium]|nr:aldehyde dehydrogenase [Elusimicrobiota bacterium]